MRFIFAIVTFVIAALTIGFAIAQETILAGPESVTESLKTAGDAPVLVIDGDALNAYAQSQSLELSGSSTITAVYGSTDDVLAWIGTASYERVSFNRETGELESTLVEGTEATVPSPVGSDLWLGEYSGENALRFRVALPPSVSILAVSNGEAAAPTELSIVWPLDNSTPWTGPLLVFGGALVVLGLIFLVWALWHMRKLRGPRRNRKMPRVPRQVRYRPQKPAAIAAPRGRRASRFTALAPVLVIGSLALGACSAGTEPLPTPDPTETAALEDIPAPAVTENQVRRILSAVRDVTAQADVELNKDLIATRAAGPALELRLASYDIRKKDSRLPGPAAIPAGGAEVVLPQQVQANPDNRLETWPRTLFAVVRDETDATVPPLALFLVQSDPRSNYKVNYAISLGANVALPEVAPAGAGAPQLPPDTKLLKLPPAMIAEAYGAALAKEDGDPEGYFDLSADPFYAAVGPAARKAELEKLPDTAQITFATAVGAGQVIAMATLDSGALVAVELRDSKTVKPVKRGAAVNVSGQVSALSGKANSVRGLVATYGDQLLFYVPLATDSRQIVLLGFSQGLISAKEL